MKKVLDVEKLDLGAIVEKGMSVRDQLVQEWKETRSRISTVNWQDELEAFKKSPLDTAQTYLNQVSEALKQRGSETEKANLKAESTKVAKRPVAKKKPTAKKKTTRAKSPRTSKAKTTTNRGSSTRTQKGTAKKS